MKYLRKFNESRTELSESQIKYFFRLENIKMNPDGSVDIPDDDEVNLTDVIDRFDLDKTQIPIKFGRIKGGITYRGDMLEGEKLTSLEGCPIECGYFFFSGAKITDLKGSPKYVNGPFTVVSTETLKSLEGGPIEVEADYECLATGITSLEGSPKIINRHFNCNYTKIKDFKGGPEVVMGGLFAGNCELTSLEGLPKEIGDSLYITNEEVWDPSPLRDVKIGLNVRGGGRINHLLEFFFWIHDLRSVNRIFGTYSIAYQRFIESLDYNWVKGSSEDPKIDLFRLKEAMNEFDIDIVQKVRNYTGFYNESGPYKDYSDSIGPYKFVGLDGERTNIFGDRI